MNPTAKLLFLGGMLFALPMVAAAQSAATLEDRVARLERLLNSDTLIELLQRVERLHKEVQELRGEVEVQTHEMTQLKQRQRELYLDMDRRLTALRESGGAPAADTTASTAEPQPSAGEGVAETTVASTPPSTGTATEQQVAPSSQGGATDPIEEQNSYQTAFNLLKAGRYDQAGAAFKTFLAEYPSGKYSDNAQYWLGEAYYVTRQFDPAMNAFNKLLEQYPESPKLTHAMLKIGYIHDELGQCAEAEQTLNGLVEKYPQSTAARLAQDRLQRLRAGGCAG